MSSQSSNAHVAGRAQPLVKDRGIVLGRTVLLKRHVHSIHCQKLQVDQLGDGAFPHRRRYFSKKGRPKDRRQKEGSAPLF